MYESIWLSMPMNTPAVAASAPPMSQVARMTRSVAMPLTRARSGSSLTARMARPMRLRVSRRCNARTSIAVTPTIQMWRA